MSADYAALEAALEAQKAGRYLPPELVTEVRGSPLFRTRLERENTLNWLRHQSVQDRPGLYGLLREMRERYDADQALLEVLWTAFGNPTDRGFARVWWDDGVPLEEIAARLGFIYGSEVTVPMIAEWPVEGGWPQRVAS